MGDSDWAGDRATRKPISGGVCRVGLYVIKTGPSRQHVIALSPAEVELHAFLKRACHILGIVNLALDFGIDLIAAVHIDASAALANAHKQVFCKLRHIGVHLFWTHERAKVEEIQAKMAFGKDNPAGLFTKHLPVDAARKHMKSMYFSAEISRAEQSLHHQ